MDQIADIVEAIDRLLEQTPLATFYEQRKALVGGNAWNGALLQIQRGGVKPGLGYAYHKGGRGELQFNVGFEDDGAFFRYGVAFSLESGRDLPDPVAVLGPKIQRYNGVVERFPELGFLRMWQRHGVRELVGPIGAVTPDFVRTDAFVFIGDRVPVTAAGVTPAMIRQATAILVALLPLYLAVENAASPPAASQSYVVARLCWNTNYWQGPSGRTGKTTNRKAFEATHGYGHEEWLFNRSTLIDGWKYGFLQAFNSEDGRHQGETLNLLLYTLDNESKRRYWVGAIDGCEVLTILQADTARAEYKRLGWTDVMRKEVRSLGLADDELTHPRSTTLVNVRFRAQALRVFESPVPFPKEELPANRYSILYDVPESQAAMIGGEDSARELIERNLKTTKTIRTVYEGTREVDLIQVQWQKQLRRSLKEDLPSDIKVKVETEIDGHHLDAVLIAPGHRVYIELKTRGTPRQVVRQAIGQLIEYAHWPKSDRCLAMLIVGQVDPDERDLAYLAWLRERYNLPVHYLPYRDGHIVGIADWYRSIMG